MDARNPALLTLKEACVVAEVPEAFARREVERRAVVPRRVRERRGKRPSVLFPDAAATYLRVVRGLGDAGVDLPPRARRELYLFLTGAPSKRWSRDGAEVVLDDSPVALRIGETERDLAERLRIFRRGRARVVSNPAVMSGTPVFQGTRIPVAMVGAVRRRGRPVDEVLEQFVGISTDDVAFAEMFVALGPRPGRPKKPLKIRRVL